MLVIGMVPILFLIVAVGTDAAVLFSHRRALAATAEAAALAGAQSADLAKLYAGKATAGLPLDCRQAQQVIAKQLRVASVDVRAGRVELDRTTCDGRKVSVRLRSTARLPFVATLGVAPTVTVRASATATSPFR